MVGFRGCTGLNDANTVVAEKSNRREEKYRVKADVTGNGQCESGCRHSRLTSMLHT
jgi:hypothetical protein